jgi:hypothetical protein
MVVLVVVGNYQLHLPRTDYHLLKLAQLVLVNHNDSAYAVKIKRRTRGNQYQVQIQGKERKETRTGRWKALRQAGRIGDTGMMY